MFHAEIDRIARLAAHAAGLVLTAGWLVAAPWPITVVDGDTVDRLGIRYRLTGFDAPEIRRVSCPAERDIGKAAKVRLEALLASAGSVRLVRRQWKPEKWGRVLARLEIDGQDVASIAIAEGWGHPYDGRGHRASWCE